MRILKNVAKLLHPYILLPPLDLPVFILFHYSRLQTNTKNISTHSVHLLPQSWLIHRVFVCHKSLSLPFGTELNLVYEQKSSAYSLQSFPRKKATAII